VSSGRERRLIRCALNFIPLPIVAPHSETPRIACKYYDAVVAKYLLTAKKNRSVIIIISEKYQRLLNVHFSHHRYRHFNNYRVYTTPDLNCERTLLLKRLGFSHPQLICERHEKDSSEIADVIASEGSSSLLRGFDIIHFVHLTSVLGKPWIRKGDKMRPNKIGLEVASVLKLTRSEKRRL